MCELCAKVNIIKDILGSYFGDEEIKEFNEKIGLPGFDVKGSRLSLCIMAIVELCVDEGFDLDHLGAGITVAYRRYLYKLSILKADPDYDKKHSTEDWLKGFES